MPDDLTNWRSSRRHFVATQALGLGSVALTWLLRQEGVLAEAVRPELEKKTFDLTPNSPLAEPKARAMISLFMQGGPSHIDLCDPKPMLDKLNGERFPGDIKYDDAAEASAKCWAVPGSFASTAAAAWTSPNCCRTSVKSQMT